MLHTTHEHIRYRIVFLRDYTRYAIVKFDEFLNLKFRDQTQRRRVRYRLCYDSVRTANSHPCRGQTAVHRALLHGAYLQQRAEWRATDWTVARLEAQTVGAEQAETQVTTRQDQRVT